MALDFLFFMKKAIDLALTARGATAPNPVVGAIVASPTGEILGKGFHPRAGEAHAEVFAINEAKLKTADLSDCLLFVTLEPCNHQGKTPPCTDLIFSSKIKNVFVGTLDPHPFMRGKSVELLRQKGCEVTVGVMETECRQIIRGFQSVLEKGRPFVTLKCATSLDGKIATASGESQWITDEPARTYAHQLRSEHDAILVGIGTVLADDPRLDVRYSQEVHPLTKVVLDSRLMMSPQSRLLKTAGEVLVYCDKSYAAARREELERAGAIVIPIERDLSKPALVNLSLVLKDLAIRGVQDLLVEGGGKVLGAFVKEQFFDRFIYIMAPKIMGSASRDVFEGFEIESLGESVRLENISARLIGPDVLIEGNRLCSPA